VPAVSDVRAPKRALAGVLLFVGPVLISACDLVSTDPAISVKNETSQLLSFEMEFEDRWYGGFGTVLPGRTSPVMVVKGDERRTTIRDGCTVGTLVALHPDGREVARYPPHLCLGDTWTVTRP
jgi:hypothetical protein